MAPGGRRAAAAGAGASSAKKKQRTIFQSSSIKEVSENEKLKGQSILLDESVYGSDPPEECRGYLYSYLVVDQVASGATMLK